MKIITQDTTVLVAVFVLGLLLTGIISIICIAIAEADEYGE